jgi:hypothetical protein
VLASAASSLIALLGGRSRVAVMSNVRRDMRGAGVSARRPQIRVTGSLASAAQNSSGAPRVRLRCTSRLSAHVTLSLDHANESGQIDLTHMQHGGDEEDSVTESE